MMLLYYAEKSVDGYSGWKSFLQETEAKNEVETETETTDPEEFDASDMQVIDVLVKAKKVFASIRYVNWLIRLEQDIMKYKLVLLFRIFYTIQKERIDIYEF